MDFSPSSSRPLAPRFYSKDLDTKIQLRLTSSDVDFLRWIADGYGLSLSGAARLIIRAYRSNLDAEDAVLSALRSSLSPSSPIPPVPSPDSLV